MLREKNIFLKDRLIECITTGIANFTKLISHSENGDLFHKCEDCDNNTELGILGSF